MSTKRTFCKRFAPQQYCFTKLNCLERKIRVQRSTRSKVHLQGSKEIKDQRSTCSTDQQIKVHQRSRFNKIKDQENQPEINFFQITDQKFKVQLFTDQITKLDLVRRKPSLISVLRIWAYGGNPVEN